MITCFFRTAPTISRTLYDSHRRYSDVVKLADRVLESERHLDKNIVHEIRYYLCQLLARQRDRRFLTEVQHMRPGEHDFLMGFYYRICGRTKEAIEKQLKAMQFPGAASRARRELVQLYVNIEQFEQVKSLAEVNYKEHLRNPYHIQAYLKCIINSSQWQSHVKEINFLLDSLKIAEQKNDRAGEMWLNALCQYYAYCLNDIEKALDTIDGAIATYPGSPYPLFTKVSVLFRLRPDYNLIEPIVEDIRNTVLNEPVFSSAIIKVQAQLQRLRGGQIRIRKNF